MNAAEAKALVDQIRGGLESMQRYQIGSGRMIVAGGAPPSPPRDSAPAATQEPRLAPSAVRA